MLPCRSAGRRGCASPPTSTRSSRTCGPSTAQKVDGVLEVGGVRLTDLVAEHGSPAYVLDEADFRARARAFRDGFAGCDVFYAGKAFLCTTVARWIDEEGLNLDVCSGGELAVAERAGFPMDRVGFHGNNKTVAELERAVELGVGRIIVDSFHEIDPARAGHQRARTHGPRDGARDRRRRGAHARVHRDRPRGPEVRLLDQQRRRARRGASDPRRRGTRAARAALPHRLPDLRLLRASRSPRVGCSRCTRRSPPRSASSCPSSTSAAASASPTPHRTTPRTPPSSPPR